MIKKYRKKPVVIEAVQWTGENSTEVRDFMGLISLSITVFDTFKIHTLEGEMNAEKGDWIIKGVKGEFYPCKPDIFELTYGEVNQDESNIDTGADNNTM